MSMTITPNAFRAFETALGHSTSGDDLPAMVSRANALPLVDGFFRELTAKSFDVSWGNWRQFKAPVASLSSEKKPTDSDMAFKAFFPDDRSLVGANINCSAGLVTFFVETISTGTQSDYHHRTALVAKTEGALSRFLRWIGYETDVETDRYGNSYLSDGVSQYSVGLVVGLSQLPAAQMLYEKVCR